MPVIVNTVHSTQYYVEGSCLNIAGSKHFLHINKSKRYPYMDYATLSLEVEEAKELLELLQAYLQEISNANPT